MCKEKKSTKSGWQSIFLILAKGCLYYLAYLTVLCIEMRIGELLVLTWMKYKAVQEIMGHRNIAIAMDLYTYVKKDIKAKEMQKFSTVFKA